MELILIYSQAFPSSILPLADVSWIRPVFCILKHLREPYNDHISHLDLPRSELGIDKIKLR